jgi:hypothetical protein
VTTPVDHVIDVIASGTARSDVSEPGAVRSEIVLTAVVVPPWLMNAPVF